MIGVIADVRLQQGFLFFSGQSAAIDKVPDYMSNLSDMGVRRDVITIWENKSRKQLGIRLERIL